MIDPAQSFYFFPEMSFDPLLFYRIGLLEQCLNHNRSVLSASVIREIGDADPASADLTYDFESIVYQSCGKWVVQRQCFFLFQVHGRRRAAEAGPRVLD